jgi:hypothetical protein
MHLLRRMPLLAAPLLLWAPCLHAQAPADPSGHWEGAIRAPDKEVKIEVDLAKNRAGEFSGTISIPAENLKGLPLKKVAVEGRSVNFYARTDQPFTGVLSADGKSLSGGLSVSGYTATVSMIRTGDPRIEPAARMAPIRKELEGTWNGTLDVKGTQLRLVLTLLNQSDGTASGNIVNLDEGMLEIPVSMITQAGSSLTLDLKIIGGSYTGVLSHDGAELAGTYRQGALVAPLMFRHAPAEAKDAKP